MVSFKKNKLSVLTQDLAICQVSVQNTDNTRHFVTVNVY